MDVQALGRVRQWARILKRDVLALYLAARDPRVPWDAKAVAAVFQRLRRARVRVGTMDLKIATIVVSRDATLLSRTLADFRQVPGLQVEDWTA
jgi:predicted nucleic acid-binding protein